VAWNAITDGLRRTPEPVADLEDGPGREPDPSDEAEAAWTAWRVHRALEVPLRRLRRLVIVEEGSETPLLSM